MNIESDSIKKILINKPGALGDYIAASVAIRKIRAKYPKAEIHLLATLYVKNVMPEGSIIDRIIDYDYYKKQGVFKFIQFIRSQKYDLAINLRWSSERDLLVTAFSGAKYTLGLANKFLSILYTNRTYCNIANTHEFEKNLMVIKPLEVSIENPEPYIFQTSLADDFVKDFFAKNKLETNKTWLISPFASNYNKSWRVEYFIETAKLVLKNDTELKLIVSYGPADKEKAEKFALQVGQNCILCPPTTIEQIVAMIKNSNRVFCNNSGIMNIAIACKTPTIIISCVSKKLWGSRGIDDITFVPDKIENATKKSKFSETQIHDLLSEIKPNFVFETLKNKNIIP